MTSTQTEINMNMENVPSNYGYISEGRKYMGRAAPEECNKIVRLTDIDLKITHIWSRRGYCSYQMNKGEANEDSWVVVGKKRTLIESRSKAPCPFELSEDGKCSHWCEPDHQKWYYHFSLRHGQVIARNEENKPYCRYHIGDCWEKYNSPHQHMFVHK